MPPPPSPPPPSLPPTDAVFTLRGFFEATRGENWTRSDGWLEGEPCVDEWHGITCCPAGYTFDTATDECVAGASGVAAGSDTGGDTVGGTVGGTGGEAGGQVDGASGGLRIPAISRANSERLGLRGSHSTGEKRVRSRALQLSPGVEGTGDMAAPDPSHQLPPAAPPASDVAPRTLGEQYCKPRDGAYATCAVVALRLNANGLSGSLAYPGAGGSGGGSGGPNGGGGDDGLCLLTELAVLSVAGNALAGWLPRASDESDADGAFATVSGGLADKSASAAAALLPLVSSTAAAGGFGDLPCLPKLVTLSVAANLLSGGLPAWVLGHASLENLDISQNLFEYPADELVAACFGRSGRALACTGVPPMSCRAFGSQWQLKADAPNECVQCSLDAPWPLVMLISVVAAFFILGGTYAALMLLRPGNLKHLFSTIGIFIAHLRA